MLPLQSVNSGRNSGALLLEASLSLLPIMAKDGVRGVFRVGSRRFGVASYVPRSGNGVIVKAMVVVVWVGQEVEWGFARGG